MSKDIGAIAIQMIRDSVDSNNVKASGRTANSLKYRDVGYRLTIYSDGSGAPLSTLEKGRPAGAVPLNFVGIIKQWIIDKNLTITPIPFSTTNPRPTLRKYTEHERGLNKMAGAIAQKIKEQGTERHVINRDDIYTPAREYAIEQFKKRHKEILIKAFTEGGKVKND